MTTPGARAAAWRGFRGGALVGLALGVVYSVGGLIVDLATVGANAGTALAFLALLGMPAIFASLGAGVGWVLWALRGPRRAAP